MTRFLDWLENTFLVIGMAIILALCTIPVALPYFF